MKRLFLIGGIFIFTGLLSGCSTTNLDASSLEDDNIVVSDDTTNNNLFQPERPMDIYGKVLAVEGNEFTIQEVDVTQDPTFGMSPEEKKEYRSNLSDAEKMELRDSLREAVLGNVKIIIPVGIMIVVKDGQGLDAVSKVGSLEDITIGSYISVWYDPAMPDRKIAEYVKKSFTK